MSITDSVLSIINDNFFITFSLQEFQSISMKGTLKDKISTIAVTLLSLESYKLCQAGKQVIAIVEILPLNIPFVVIDRNSRKLKVIKKISFIFKRTEAEMDICLGLYNNTFTTLIFVISFPAKYNLQDSDDRSVNLQISAKMFSTNLTDNVFWGKRH